MIVHIVDESDDRSSETDDGRADEDALAGVAGAGARTRRVDGARQPVSELVVFANGARRIEGWALNMSRGGLRAAIEAPVEVDEAFEITVGDAPPRAGRVVWVRNQKDGAIVGVAFDDCDGSIPPPPTPVPPPPADPSP